MPAGTQWREAAVNVRVTGPEGERADEEQVALADRFPDLLTLPAYELIG